MKKVLIAIDDRSDSMKAVEYVGQFGGSSDLQIQLVHVLPNLPAIFWDEGHILSEDEKRERQKVVDKWIADQNAKMEPVFKSAIDSLVRSGITPQQIRTKSISDSTDVADSILEEARDGGCQTVVVGRCDRSAKHIIGSVANKVVAEGRGMVVTVVE